MTGILDFLGGTTGKLILGGIAIAAVVSFFAWNRMDAAQNARNAVAAESAAQQEVKRNEGEAAADTAIRDGLDARLRAGTY